MRAAFRLALADLRGRSGLMIGAVLLVSVPIAGFLVLHAFVRGIDIDFASQPSADLIVQEANSIGEIAGSRIPSTAEADLRALGVRFAIPEIHAVAGSSADNAVLLRGVDLDRYRSIVAFDLVEGRGLQPGDSSDSVMLGADLAASRGVGAGDPVLLRGRGYRVVGVFEVGTYADNEAWLSLEGARDLLGWGDDVSVFVVPDDGVLAEGEVIPGPLSVARRGDVVDLADEWDPILSLAALASLSLAVAAAVVMAAILWRLAWLRRRELAILRSIGLGRRVPFAYLGAQGAAVAIGGLLAGVGGGLMLGRTIRISAFGISARAVFDGTGIVRGVALTAGILAVAVLVATVRMLRARPAEMLRED